MSFLYRLRAIVWPSAGAPDTPDGDSNDEDNNPLLTKTLDTVTVQRRKLLGRLKFLDPLVEPNIVVHLLALSLMLWIWGISLARAHTFTLFSFHPVFMSLGCVLFMTEGILAYRNHSCFTFLAPIMRNSARVKLQNIHRGFHVLAAACVGLGMAFILGNKVKKHRTILPTSIHAALGFMVCALIVVQVIIGIEKLDAQRSGVEGRLGSAMHKWHGKAGLVLYDVAMATVATGMLKSLGWSFMTVFLLLHLGAVWFLVHLQMVAKPFRPTGDGGLSEREMVDLNRVVGAKDVNGVAGVEGGMGRGPRGSFGGGRKDSSGEISESI